jgi:hypothetical protein
MKVKPKVPINDVFIKFFLEILINLLIFINLQVVI